MNQSFWDKTIKIYYSPIQYSYFNTFWEEIGRLRSPKSIFKAPWEIYFWAILLQNGLRSQFLRKLKYWLWNKYRKVRNKSRGLYFYFFIFSAAYIRWRAINKGGLYIEQILKWREKLVWKLVFFKLLISKPKHKSDNFYKRHPFRNIWSLTIAFIF